MKQLTYACGEILKQLQALIAGITTEDFARPSQALGGATIGQHVRHTLEFFLCLQNGFGSGVVNYDRRAHDKGLETDRAMAINSVLRIHDFVCDHSNNKSLTLEVGYFLDSAEHCSIPTTYHRELSYTIEHAVHHMAIIKIGLREIAPYVIVTENFGVAASTVRHKETIVAPAE